MTLVTIDLGDVAGGHDPDDHVVIRAENFRESTGGGITSTAEVKIPLVDGVGEREVEPGPVVVSFRCRAVADTREKRGVVPDEGPVGIEDVIAGDFVYTPPVVNRGLDLIEGARDEALAEVQSAVTTAVTAQMGAKADKTQVDQLTDRVDQLTAQVMACCGGGTVPDPVDPDPEDPDPVDPYPEPTEVEAPAPSWTDNSDGGGEWTTPEVEGIEYSPASGTATPGQTVTVTATALDGYVLLGATEWTHTFPEDPDPVDPYPGDNPYSFALRADTAPVNDRNQIYALTAEEWAALSYLRDQTASHADPLGALNVALLSYAAKIIGVTSVTERALVEDSPTNLGKVRTVWLRNKSTAYNSFVTDIGPVITEISTYGVLI